MMKQVKFSIRQRIQSFRFALNGLRILFREEHNSHIHLLATLFTIITGIVLGISIAEWTVILFAIGLVVTMEIVNTTIENIADFISPEKHYAIKKIKDLAAAGVLVCSLTALIIGIIIFMPKLFQKLL